MPQSYLRFCSALCASVLLPFAIAPFASAQSSNCADGIIRSAKSNEQIQLCNIVAQRDPKLAEQLDAALKLLGQQQTQITGLVKAVNAVGRNVDPARQTKMLESLAEKLQSSPSAAPQRAEHLTNDLNGLEQDIQGMKTDPTAAALTQAKLEGALGDAVAQLDVAEAKADLADIRATLGRIEAQTTHIQSTTDATQKDVGAINRQMNVLMAGADPSRVLPKKEADLYMEITPIWQECQSFAVRWMQADTEAMKQATPQRTAYQRVASPFELDIEKGSAPILDQYSKSTQPRLAAWREKVIQQDPSLAAQGEFKPLTLNPEGNRMLVMRAGGTMNQLLIRYKREPGAVPELVTEGTALEAEMRGYNSQFAAVNKAASEAEFERSHAAQPAAATPATGVGGMQAALDLYRSRNPEVDGRFQKEFQTTLQPRMEAWVRGANEFTSQQNTIDFSQVESGMGFQSKVCGAFARVMAPFSQKVTRDFQAAAAAAR